MQLFITPYKEKNTTIIIEDKEILNQVRKVLRLKKWDSIYVQDTWTRHEVKITDWTDTVLTGESISQKEKPTQQETNTLIVCMPNKWDKIELIVQKLTEISIDHIIFRPSERSILKDRNTKKEERVLKIAKEAVEQSRWWNIPTITFTKDISPYIKNKKIKIFDKWGTTEKTNATIGIVGPEGWLTANDYQQFAQANYTIQSLWETILRTETAAIIAWRQIKNA